MRVRFAVDAGDATVDALRAAFAPVAERFGDDAGSCAAADAPYRTLILVSKFEPLPQRPAVPVEQRRRCTSTSRPSCRTTSTASRWRTSYGVPFHHVPVTPDTKAEAEARMLELVDELDVDLVVLARYMQVLSDDTCRGAVGPGDQHPPLVPAELQGRAALPPGLRPRRQADRRHRALRDRGPRRGSDHRAGRGARRPRLRRRRTSSPPAATSRARCSPAPSAGTPSPGCCSTVTRPSSSADRPGPPLPVPLPVALPVSQVMPTFWHSPWEISHGECQFLGITWETDPLTAGMAGAGRAGVSRRAPRDGG